LSRSEKNIDLEDRIVLASAIARIMRIAESQSDIRVKYLLWPVNSLNLATPKLRNV
jgi:hypothetical protein